MRKMEKRQDTPCEGWENKRPVKRKPKKTLESRAGRGGKKGKTATITGGGEKIKKHQKNHGSKTNGGKVQAWKRRKRQRRCLGSGVENRPTQQRSHKTGEQTNRYRGHPRIVNQSGQNFLCGMGDIIRMAKKREKGTTGTRKRYRCWQEKVGEAKRRSKKPDGLEKSGNRECGREHPIKKAK